jgi:type IV secretion system protein VirB10
MSAVSAPETGEPPAAAPAPQVAIRARPPSPKRLSRKVLMAGAIGAAALAAFALVSGLSDRPRRNADAEQSTVASAGGPPESIQSASAQYEAGDLPFGQVGAGDDAILLEQGETAGLAPPRDAVWANDDAGPAAPAPHATGAAPPDPQAIARAAPILFTGSEPNARAGSDDGRLDAELTPPRSPYEVQAGHVIPAALVTGLNSDLPGRVVAQVTAPVFDSVTGAHLLIPQGARLIGTYDNGVAYGDNRILLVWNRLLLPNGWSLDLSAMEASDPAGAAGLADRTDNHLGRLAGAVGLSAIISVIANEAEDSDPNNLGQSVGDAAAQQAAQTGGRIVDRELTVHPTLRVRPGAPVRVLVTRTIGLRPYRGPAR